MMRMTQQTDYPIVNTLIADKTKTASCRIQNDELFSVQIVEERGIFSSMFLFVTILYVVFDKKAS